MDDLSRRMARARDQVSEPWNDVRASRLLRDVHQRADGQRPPGGAKWWLAPVVVVLIAGAAALLWWPRQSRVAFLPETAASPERPPGADAGVVTHARAPDTHTPPSIETRSSNGGRVRVVRATASALALRVDAGRVDIELDLAEHRAVTVAVGELHIAVNARSFAVERAETRVGVWVFEGTVEVAGPTRTREVRAGETEWFNAPAQPEPNRTARRHSGRESPPWRALATEGRFDEAYESLSDRDLDRVHGPRDLILAADVARLTGHPDAAVGYLTQMLSEHSEDSRAPLAAFTLGRVYLYELGRPRDAAAAFIRARRLAPESSVAEDALAREVEAWSRAGVDDRAREAAKHYVARYPAGHWVRKVTRYGGLE